jgi:hypothetical protein
MVEASRLYGPAGGDAVAEELVGWDRASRPGDMETLCRKAPGLAVARGLKRLGLRICGPGAGPWAIPPACLGPVLRPRAGPNRDL